MLDVVIFLNSLLITTNLLLFVILITTGIYHASYRFTFCVNRQSYILLIKKVTMFNSPTCYSFLLAQ